MNQIIPTTTRRRSLRHVALALCALVALVAASCTADALDGTDPGAPSGNNPDDVLTFAVASRPGFTEAAATRGTDTKAVIPGTKAVIPGLTRDLPNQSAALIEQEIAGQARNDRESARNDRGESTAPATRATQTDDGTQWQQGDILWLTVQFFQNKQDVNTLDTGYTSALKYDGAEWRYLTEAEAKDLNAGNFPGFTRLVRWPRESKDWPAPGMFIAAYYAGNGKPGADGTITITPKGEIPTTPFIVGRSGVCSPDVQTVPLEFMYENISRVRIPAGCKIELTNAEYRSTIGFLIDKGTDVKREQITEIPAQLKDTDVFLSLSGISTAKLTRDNVSYTFTFPTITDAEGYPIWAGLSYTLTFYTSGTEIPGGYDLTIADEAGLRAFAQAVNAGDRLPNGKPAAEARVLQTANIHLTQGEWVPIGTGLDNPFRGAYNGNGNEISGLTIKTAPQPDARNDSYVGLFGRAEGAVLTGIRLREVGINFSQGSGGNVLYVGSIAGRIDNSTLSLCTANGTMNADGGDTEVDAGGIAGYSQYSTISRCQADVEIKAASTKGNATAYAGGIAGWNGVCNFILSCESGDKAVTAEGEGGGQTWAWAGGIAGSSSNNSYIAFCRTGKNVVTARSGDYAYAGGLVGENGGNLFSCYSHATAEATGEGVNRRVGAIVGYSPGGEGYCYATGATGKGTSNLNAVPDNIVYNTNPKDGDIFRVMTGFTGKVESIDNGGTPCYPFTTTYDPSATPAYGIIPQRAVWTKDAWKDGGSDPRFPEINIEAYEGK